MTFLKFVMLGLEPWDGFIAGSGYAKEYSPGHATLIVTHLARVYLIF
jgi:hypothetical protein